MQPAELTTVIAGSDIASVAGWLIAASSSIVLGYHAVKRMISSEKQATTSSDAVGAVITMLHAEVSRLSEQNHKLATVVNELQLQLIELRNDNDDLRRSIEDFCNGCKTK